MTVSLVGAGPGDPELLTGRAARLITSADVIVHDALVDASILDLAPRSAEIIDVGKRPGRAVPQEMINALLVHLGHQGRNVVRLKGGDPYVFGRGGEEALALRDAGIPFTVVPGVTSAVGAPAAAGIPVTHRGVSVGFTVVTGHRERGGASSIDWESLAKVGTTIVVLMGVAERGVIAERLMRGGLEPATPVAAIRFGTRHAQEVVRCVLAGLGAARFDSPASIVFGAVAAFDLGGLLAAT
ncbi:MAG: uroporphyrinogen-III C-methyltransferase, partial [Actinomycetota bacterium]